MVPDGNGGMRAAWTPEDGYIGYGAQVIDQRVLEAKDGRRLHDDVGRLAARSARLRPGLGTGRPAIHEQSALPIFTPRDLATYVHVDQLYQAYLNACLILLNSKTPFDPSFNLLSGSDDHKLMANAVTRARG